MIQMVLDCAPVKALTKSLFYFYLNLDISYRQLQLALLTRGSMIYFGPADKANAMFDAAGLPCPSQRSAIDHFLHVIK
jgi:hypothetical protein